MVMMSLLIFSMACISASDVSDISYNHTVDSSSLSSSNLELNGLSEDASSVSDESDVSGLLTTSCVSSSGSAESSGLSSSNDLGISGSLDSTGVSSSADEDAFGNSRLSGSSLSSGSAGSSSSLGSSNKSGLQSSTTNSKNSTTIVSSGNSVVNGNDYSVTLKDKNTNTVLSNKNIIFTLNGNNYTKTTNSQGVASLTINANAGNYTLAVRFIGDGLYYNSSKTVALTVVKDKTTFVDSGSSIVKGNYYYLTLKDSKGNVLFNKTVSLTFNGKTYTRITDSLGKVGLKLNSPTVGKTYKLGYKFGGDDGYNSSSGFVNLNVKLGTTVSGSGSAIVQGNYYYVTLKDANGNALSGKTVNFTFPSNGKTYKRTTNSQGKVSLKISATAGKTYQFAYSYDGNSYYGSSAESVSLYVKNSTSFVTSGNSIIKGNNYYVTLRDNVGNVLSNKTVSLTFNGKTYTRITDSLGKVGLKLNSPTVGKTYKLGYKFGGDDGYNSSSGFVNLNVKLGTTVSGSGSAIVQGNNYYVTLKDANGNVLSNKTVTFKFPSNGKTYTKTTNSKGVVSLKISATAGKAYQFAYSYGGSSYYGSSSSGIFNLTVKLSSSISNSGTSIMNDSLYKVTLKDSSGKALSGKNITFAFNGKTYQKVTNANGVASLNISVSTPKSYALTYSFAGDGMYNASLGSVSLTVKSAKVFTVSQILASSKTLRTYIETNGKVPSTVSVNGISMNLSSFSYLMSKALVSINSGKDSVDIGLIAVKSNYSNKGNSSINGNLYKANYIALANKLINYAESNGAIPNYVNTSLGLISPNLYTFGLSKALQYYSVNKVLPNYLILSGSDVSGSSGGVSYSSTSLKGNSSQFKKGLNEIANLTASELNSYLSSSGYDSLNSAIKTLANKLVSGKSSTWDKAVAIFNYVRDDISYSFYSNSNKGAATTLSSKSANCCDQANLVVALCRAANIPARFSHAQGCTFSSGLVTGHVWAQIYVNGVWYSADATSTRNSLGNIHNWNIKSFSSLKQYAHLPF